MKITVRNTEETEKVAEIIGAESEAGNTIILSGELGAGKTTLTKGIASGLGISQMVKSPTYTIIREYTQGRLPLYHMDVYRVGNAVDDLELDDYFEGDGLTVVEWGRLLESFMPQDFLEINFKKDPVDINQRMIELSAVGIKSEHFLNKIEQKWREIND